MNVITNESGQSNVNALSAASYTLRNLGKINILMGKNGCGKSTLMRSISDKLRERTTESSDGKVKYISPERGGVLIYDPNTDHSILHNPDYLPNTRSNNQVDKFKHQTIAQFHHLETLVLRNYESDNSNPKFCSIIDQINNLLLIVEIRRSGATFKVFLKSSNDEVSPSKISSGESELLALAMECLVFKYEKNDNKQNILFLDEPDVHLHPDSQIKLMRFLCNLVDSDDKIKIIIATHSTVFLGIFEEFRDLRVCFMGNRQKELEFYHVTETHRTILPIFGAHPLSQIFNENPILIVEGEDDVRIWQQVVRTSLGRIKLYPCEAGGKDAIEKMRSEAKQILNAVYDQAKGYSLRDRDDDLEEIEDDLLFTNFRLSCRNAENLILSNESLLAMGIDWGAMKQKISKWISEEKIKPETEQSNILPILKDFSDKKFDRKSFDLKKVRNILVVNFGQCDKPWEVLVGQAIAQNLESAHTLLSVDGSIFNFLGEKIVEKLFIKSQS